MTYFRLVEIFIDLKNKRFKRFDPISLSSKIKRNENCQLINIRLSKKDSCQKDTQEKSAAE